MSVAATPRVAPTPMDALVAGFDACLATPDGTTTPAVVLWTDPGREWTALVDALRQRMPHLLILGDYDPARRTGPAIWLRCVVDGTIALEGASAETPPVVYLPGIGRQQLRAGEDCPKALEPLVELMFRGTLWLQKGGHDWTVTAFLSSTNGLGLDLARDQETLAALQRALPEVAEVPVDQLRGRRLEAEDFDRLLTPDLNRDLLRWMSGPAAWREAAGAGRWEAFRQQCTSRLGFDPEKDGDRVAGERLGGGESGWAEVWGRFEEAPGAYPGIPGLLRRSKPATLFVDRSRWPDENEAAEASLRSALVEVPRLASDDACVRILALEDEHGPRRAWVWARMGLAPWAGVLEHLATLARRAESVVGGAHPDDVARTYLDGRWRADAASWQALASAPADGEAMVQEVVRALLLPWLDASARVFQEAVDTHPLPSGSQVVPPEATEGGCLLFVDGLRFDLGQLLAERLEERGCRVHRGHRWAALPTVTATAKPAVTPLARQIEGSRLPDDFCPTLAPEAKPATVARLRAAMEKTGYQLVGGELGDWPASDSARGWCEAGRIDSVGHKLAERLPHQIASELGALEERILSLLEAGWGAVRIVTDHGWLLLPGGLPKVDLPKHLTESRWARCATIAGASRPGAPTAPWFWNSEERFATAPGVACFNAAPVYAHGGISLQECLIPDLLVERGTIRETRATIESVRWRGMRCIVEATASGGAVRADVREGRVLGKSLVASVKALDEEGRASLVVEDDRHEGAEAVVVLLDNHDTVLAQRTTRVGEAR